MRIKYLGSAPFSEPAKASFAVPMAQDEERGVSDDAGQWALRAHPDLFVSLEPVAPATDKPKASKGKR